MAYINGKLVLFSPQGYTHYTLPIAAPDTLGGVKPVTKTDNMNQAVGVDENGALFIEGETWNDKPVKTKLVDCGYFTGTEKNIDTGISMDHYDVVRFEPYVYTQIAAGAEQALTVVEIADAEIRNTLDGTTVNSSRNYAVKVAPYSSTIVIVRKVIVLIKYVDK